MQARTFAANYRVVGQPGRAGYLPVARITPSLGPLWDPTLVDRLRTPLTRYLD